MSSILAEREGHLGLLTIDRPAKLNALDHSTITELGEAFAEFSADPEIAVIILTGAGEKAFIAGADISGLVGQGVIGGRKNARHGQNLGQAFEDSPKPVLCAINGYALGGGLELALACDLRYASTKASLGLPEVSLGAIPGYGGTQRLPRLIGMGSALELILSGNHIKADEALRIGLVNAVFAPEALMDEVKKRARRIASRGPTALAFAKRAARRGAQLSLSAGLALEADLFGMISSTEEMAEGLQAFLDKRKASWVRE